MNYTNTKNRVKSTFVALTFILLSGFSPVGANSKGLVFDQMTKMNGSQDLVSTPMSLFSGEIESKKFPVAADRKPMSILKVVATAYSSDPNQTDDTPCAPAMWKYDLCENFLKYGEENTIAANFLPLGTKVRFPELYGTKVFTVRDRMNSRYNYDQIGYYRIDFYKVEAGEDGEIDTKASKNEAVQFGVKRNLKMEILGV